MGVRLAQGVHARVKLPAIARDEFNRFYILGFAFALCHYGRECLFSVKMADERLASWKFKGKRQNPVSDNSGLPRKKGYPLDKRRERGWIGSNIFQSALVPLDKTS